VNIVATGAFGSVAPEALPWLSVGQMREVDRIMMDDLGISLVRMMENAGRNLALLARRLLGGAASGRRVLVLAGPGGNGGGGLVAARHLHTAGADVAVVLSEDRLAPIPSEQLEILRRIGVPVGVGTVDDWDPELVVDALLGYSQRGDPQGDTRRLIEWTTGRRVLSLDNPSGLELETGVVRRPCVQAEATLTLAAPKEGLRARGTRTAVGELFVADISVPPLVYERLGIRYLSPFGESTIVRVAEDAEWERPR